MKAPILIQTDFSRNSSAVATMYGICQSVDPEVPLFDLTHAIPPFDIFAASHMLNNTAPFWPAGTIFVSVVDPGVGTDRRACVALLENGQYVVTPDNGTLSHLDRSVGIREIRQIDTKVNRWPTTLSCDIFHGRDIFAYTAVRLASGIIDFAGVGPAYPTRDLVRIPFDYPSFKEGVFEGIIESSGPHLGLVASNIPDTMFQEAKVQFGDHFWVRIRHEDRMIYENKVAFYKSFAFVDRGQPVLFVGATASIQIALREANITRRFGIGAGPDWKISMKMLGD